MNTSTGGQAVTVITEDRFFRALVQIRNVLGPDSFGCSEPICEGCQAEAAEALRIANEALGFASGQSTDSNPDEPKKVQPWNRPDWPERSGL